MIQWLDALFIFRSQLFIDTAVNAVDRQIRKNLMYGIRGDLKQAAQLWYSFKRSEIYTDCVELTRVYKASERERYNIRVTGTPDNRGNIVPLFFDIFSREYDDFYRSRLFLDMGMGAFNAECLSCEGRERHDCSVTIKNGGNDFIPAIFPVKDQAMLSVFCSTCGYEVYEKTVRLDTLARFGITTHRSQELMKEKAERRKRLFQKPKL